MRPFPLIGLTVLFLLAGVLQVMGEESRFTVSGEIVLDRTGGLMWARQDNGADISLADAASYCRNFRAGGYRDWRLPSQQELATLYDLQAGERAGGYSIVSSIHISGCCVWASDTRDSRVASFDFDYGNPDWGHPNSTINARVLPVRNLLP
jgi:hypothetical protein